MGTDGKASHITLGQGEGRLALNGTDLHAGEPIEVLIEGHWIPGHVEWEQEHGWVLRVSQQGRGQSSMSLLLRPGMVAR